MPAVLLLALIAPRVAWAAWPTEGDWIPVLKDGTPFQDDANDFNNDINLVGPGVTSIYIFNDGSNLHVRFRLDASPLTNQGQLRSFGWGALFDTDGDLNSYEYMLMLDGISEELYVAKNTSPTNIGDPSDKAETILWQQDATQDPAGNYRVTTADTNFGGDADYFLDFKAPYSVIKSALGIDDNDPLQLFFGTSASAQTLSKDLTGADLFDGMSDFVLPTGQTPSDGSILFVDSLAGTTEDDEITVGDMLYVRVIDADQNSIASSAETVTTTVTAPSGDSESVVLTETGTDTGVFTGSIPTAGGSATEDGTLQTTPIEILDGVYVDGTDVDLNQNVQRTDSIQVLPLADLAVDVTMAENLTEVPRGSTPSEGDQLRYVVTLTNNGPSESFSAQVGVDATFQATTDAPGQAGTGLALDSFAVSGSDSYNSSTGVWALGSLASGSSRTLELIVTVESGTVDENITMNAAVNSASQGDPQTPNNADNAVVSVQGADIAVIKTVDDTSPSASQQVQFTLTATNNGNATATNVVVTDNLPEDDLTFVSASSVDYDDTTGEWTIGSLNVGQSINLTIDATVSGSATSGQTIVNTASIDGAEADPVSANDSSSVTLTVDGVDLVVAKNVNDASPAEGDTITFTIDATNPSGNPASSVVVNDVLPPGLTFVSATATTGTYDDVSGDWTIGGMASAAAETLTIDASVDAGTAGDTLTNTASINAAETDVDSGNDSASAAADVTYSDLELTKTVDDETPVDGQTIRFTITVTNNGPADTTGVVVNDYIPQYVDNVTTVSTSQGTFNTGTGVWSLGGMSDGATETLVFDADVDVNQNDPDSFFNTAEVTASDQADIVTSNNVDSVAIKIGGTDLAVAIAVSNDSPSEGDSISYTVTLTNNGPNDATGVTVEAMLPTGVSFVSYSAVSGGDNDFGSYSDNSGEWDFGNNDTLASGSTATLTINTTVDAGTTGDTIEMTANLQELDQGDTDTANDTVSVSIFVGAADLALSKTVNEASPNVGDTVTFTVTLTNTGPNGVTDASVDDALPTGLAIVSSTTTAGAYDDVAGEWTGIGALASGDSATLTIDATVDAGTGGSNLTNTASIASSPNPDPDPANNTASQIVDVQLADLAVNKLVDDATPFEGDNITYSIIVINQGPDPATGVSVADVIDCGGAQPSPCLDFVGSSGVGTFDDSTGVWTLGQTLAANSSETLALTYEVVGEGDVDITNTATGSADQADDNSGNDSASLDVTPQIPSDLSTSTKEITNSGDVDPGDTLQYLITLINTSTTEADNVEFSDTLQTSPVSLTFQGASTTCTDESGSPLPAPSHSGGEVTLTNISVPDNSSCTVTIDAQVGSGDPGDLIDNTAIVTNPTGEGATPRVATLLLSESAIPAVVGKQLYLEDLGGTNDLTRTPPSSPSATVLDSSNTNESFVAPGTVRQADWQAGEVEVGLHLDSNNIRNDALRSVTVRLQANTQDGSGLVNIGEQTRIVPLGATPTRYRFRIDNPSTKTLFVGSTFLVEVITNESDDTLPVRLSQVASADYSEFLFPVNNALEVTTLAFYDLSATDDSEDPGCDTTFSCGTQISPPEVVAGNTIWVRATIADMFGSSDVNTGCDGTTSTNCPTITVTDPEGDDQTPSSPGDELTFVAAPDSTSRLYEFEIYPAGAGLDDTWQVEVEGTEGVEGVIFDTAAATFDRLGPPVLTVVKSSTGTPDPSSVITYTNAISNTGESDATSVVITNELGKFQALELIDDGGTWTSVSSLTNNTVTTEQFDDGDSSFTYDPDSEGVCASAGSPCYDPAITEVRIELADPVPSSGSVNQAYRARIE